MPDKGTYRVVGDCQAPVFVNGDIVQGDLVTDMADCVFEPGERLVVRHEGCFRLITYSPDDWLPGTFSLIARNVVNARGDDIVPQGTVHAGLDLWFRQDVARILASTWETMQATSRGPELTARPRAMAAMTEGVEIADERVANAYRRGFEDALRSVSIAFGLAESNGQGAGSSAVPTRRDTWPSIG